MAAAPLAALLLCAPFAASAASAQPADRFGSGVLSAKDTENRLGQWARRIDEAEQLLIRSEPKKAYKELSKLLDAMSDHFVSGPAVKSYLGKATALRAVAAYGLNRRDEALWHWNVAMQLFPEIRQQILDSHAAAGAFLEENRFAAGDSVELSHPAASGAIERPRRLKDPKPSFPVAKLAPGMEVSVMVSAIVGVDGAVRLPRILDSKGEVTLVYRALDAFRLWTFVPAKRNGKPVAVFYVMTVNFRAGT